MKKLLIVLMTVISLTSYSQTDSTVEIPAFVTVSYSDVTPVTVGFGGKFFDKIIIGASISVTRNYLEQKDVLPSLTLSRLISNDLIVGTELTYYSQSTSSTKFGFGAHFVYKICPNIGILYGNNTFTGSRIGIYFTSIF